MSTTNYCHLPFRGMQIASNGSLKPCCLYKPHLSPDYKSTSIENFDTWWTQDLTSLRKTVSDNDIDPGCSACYTHPLRQVTNKIFSIKPKHQVADTPEWIEINFGNYCNLKCIMCHPYNSSQIEQEYKSNVAIYNKNNVNYSVDTKSNKWWEDPVTFQRVIDMCKNAVNIHFSGGEPMIGPMHKLLDALPENCSVSMNTSLTKLSNRILTSLKRFSNCKIQVSLDGVEQHHEYIRWGSDWKIIEYNINQILELPVKLEFSYLLQHTSIYTWPALWKYLSPLNKPVFVTPVYDGSVIDGMLTINSAPQKDVDRFVEWHKENVTPYHSIINDWLSNYQFDAGLHQHFKNYVGMLDSIRGCNFTETFSPSW